MHFRYPNDRAITLALKRFRDRLNSRFPELIGVFDDDIKDVFARVVSDVSWHELKRGCSEKKASRYDHDCPSSELMDRHLGQYERFMLECAKYGRLYLDKTRLTAFICDACLTARDLPKAGEYQGSLDIVGGLGKCISALHEYENNPQLVPSPDIVEMFRMHALSGEPENRANVQESVYVIASNLTWNDAPAARQMSALLFETLRECGNRYATLQLAKLLTDGAPKKNHQQAMRMAEELLNGAPFAEDWANADLQMLAGALRFSGDDGTRDQKRALSHFKKAALLGDVNAARLLEKLYAKSQTTDTAPLVKPSLFISDAYGRLADTLTQAYRRRNPDAEV